MQIVNRITCPDCEAQCIENEAYCWQCGQLIARPPGPGAAQSPPAEAPLQSARSNGRVGAGLLSNLLNKKDGPPPPPRKVEDLIQFEPGASASQREEPVKRMAMTLTGEMVEVEEAVGAAAPAGSAACEAGQPEPETVATIGDQTILPGEKPTPFRQTWCKHCGYDNPEGVVECIKCHNMLEVLEEAPKDIEPLPRAWGFDALGAVWIVLGFAAVFAGQFLLKADASHKHATLADYFWTGIVVCAPGIFIFMRHHFCKLLFWVMSLGSALVWAVIGFIWRFVGMQITDEGQLGLIWLAVLSGLSVASYFIVRQNDAFDYGS